MSATTLFVGGPMDGEIRVVEDARRVVYAAEPLDLSPASFVASPVEVVEVRKSAYYGETLSFFGVPLLVHLHESLAFGRASRSVLAVRLGAHLLSEKGRSIVRA